jgi:hypothetical protein
MAGLEKAFLEELKADLSDVKPGGKVVKVQFNPETLKLSFANQIQTPNDQKSGTAGKQYVGKGTTKLNFQIWFDVTAAEEEEHRVDDVRRLTQEVSYFMEPKELVEGGDPTKFVPPCVRFRWGTFMFDGIIESLEESIEFFSVEGKPQRASISLSLSQQKIIRQAFKGTGRVPGLPPVPGMTPLTQAAAGSTLQALASMVGRGGDWQRIAEANGIENPRHLAPGQLIDLAQRK